MGQCPPAVFPPVVNKYQTHTRRSSKGERRFYFLVNELPLLTPVLDAAWLPRGRVSPQRAGRGLQPAARRGLTRPTRRIRFNLFSRLRACLKIRMQVAQATGLCRPATRRTEGRGRRKPRWTAFFCAGVTPFRSASRRPEQAGRLFHPFLKQALIQCDDTGTVSRGFP